MISLLESIFATLGQFGKLVLWGAVESLNLVFVAVQAAFNAVTFASLPEPPEPPGMIEAINWFYPLGGLVSIASTMATAYGTFLLVRWLFKKVGTL